MTSERIIFQSRYGVVYGIRKNDYFTAYMGDYYEVTHEEVKTEKTANKPNKALIRAWEKYGKD